MPDTYYYIGTIPQYWSEVFAECKRIRASLGWDPFEFESPRPNSQPLDSYKLNLGDEVIINIWNSAHTYNLTLDAEYSPGRNAVQLIIHYQNVYTAEAESAIAVWKQIKQALEQNGQLTDSVNPNPKPAKPPRPHRGADVDAWFTWYDKMHKSGYKCTLREIAEEVSLSEKYIRRLHANYRHSHKH